MNELEKEVESSSDEGTLADSSRENYYLSPSLALLEPKQVRAIEALLSSTSLEQASKLCGTPVRTLYTWLHHNAAFQRALLEANADSFKEFSTFLVKASNDALVVLHELATDKNIPAGVRQRSASDLAAMRFQAKDQFDLELRIEAIQKANEATADLDY
jgi:hypothetical protein